MKGKFRNRRKIGSRVSVAKKVVSIKVVRLCGDWEGRKLLLNSRE